jgi:small subunit ribosomal protein S17
MAEETKKTESTKTEKVSKKNLRGVVVSAKMTDTVVVAVSRYVKHPKYKKYQKKVKKYHAHDKGNTLEVGDNVEITETTPISKTKKFIVVTK